MVEDLDFFFRTQNFLGFDQVICNLWDPFLFGGKSIRFDQKPSEVFMNFSPLLKSNRFPDHLIDLIMRKTECDSFENPILIQLFNILFFNICKIG